MTIKDILWLSNMHFWETSIKEFDFSFPPPQNRIQYASIINLLGGIHSLVGKENPFW